LKPVAFFSGLMMWYLELREERSNKREDPKPVRSLMRPLEIKEMGDLCEM
jgi:hypothetical protein